MEEKVLMCGRHVLAGQQMVTTDKCPRCVAEHDKALYEYKRAEKTMATANDTISRVRPLLEKSVQPVCGSAHQPNRRIYAFESIPGCQGKLVVVNWDHGSDGRGMRGGAHVSVEEAR